MPVNVFFFFFFNCSYFDFTSETGIKINQVDMLTSRGYDPLRISSHAIEAYLIQVHNLNFSKLNLIIIEILSAYIKKYMQRNYHLMIGVAKMIL